MLLLLSIARYSDEPPAAADFDDIWDFFPLYRYPFKVTLRFFSGLMFFFFFSEGVPPLY
jgi:hypothetical protein